MECLCVSVCVSRSITATFLQDKSSSNGKEVDGQDVPEAQPQNEQVSISTLFLHRLVISLDR